MSDKGKTMPSAEALHFEVGQRVAATLREVYRDNAAKRIARDFSVEERTAKGWLAGNTPAGKHLLALMHRLGAGFAARVLVPVGDWTSVVAAEARLDALKQEYEQLGRDLTQLRTIRIETNEALAARGEGAMARTARETPEGAGGAPQGESGRAVDTDPQADRPGEVASGGAR